jgi:hypothetical protein
MPRAVGSSALKYMAFCDIQLFGTQLPLHGPVIELCSELSCTAKPVQVCALSVLADVRTVVCASAFISRVML